MRIHSLHRNAESDAEAINNGTTTKTKPGKPSLEEPNGGAPAIGSPAIGSPSIGSPAIGSPMVGSSAVQQYIKKGTSR